MRLFISRPPQKYFLVLQLGILLATLVFLFSILTSCVTRVMESSYAYAAGGVNLNLLFDALMHELFVKISVLFIGVFFLSAILGLFFLERLTGPLIRIQRVLEEIGSGRIPEADVNLRQEDYPNDLANALSSAVAYLRRKKAGV